MKRDKHPVAPSSPFREDLVAISQRPVKDATGNLVTLRKNVTRETAEALVERAERHVAAENFDAAMLDLETALAMDVPTPAKAELLLMKIQTRRQPAHVQQLIDQMRHHPDA